MLISFIDININVTEKKIIYPITLSSSFIMEKHEERINIKKIVDKKKRIDIQIHKKSNYIYDFFNFS